MTNDLPKEQPTNDLTQNTESAPVAAQRDWQQFKKKILAARKPPIEGSFAQQNESFLEEYFYPGSDALIPFRKSFIAFSIDRAKERLAREAAFKQTTKGFQLKAKRLAKYAALKEYQLVGTQIASENRALSCISLSSAEGSFYTGDWSGKCVEWQTETLQPKQTLWQHTDKISGIAVSNNALVAACSFDGTIGIMRNSTLVSTFSAQTEGKRCCKVQFHPNGQVLGSVGADAMLKVWDLPTQTPIWIQPAHRNTAFCLDFHPDGSLVATGGLEGVGKVWDLRSGHAILSLEQQQHSKGITSISFASNGHSLASGGEDGLICLWDLRAMKPTKKILAHSNVLTQCKWEQSSDAACVYSCGFDGKLQINSTLDHKNIATVDFCSGGKVSGFDVSADGKTLIAVSLDRTIKHWHL